MVPDHLKSTTIEYKKALAGLLLWILEGISYLVMRLKGELKPELIGEALLEIKTYLQQELLQAGVGVIADQQRATVVDQRQALKRLEAG